MTRPDIYQIAAFKGQALDLDKLQYLHPESLSDMKKFVNEAMVEAAKTFKIL